jgi:hypothetical protein
LTTESGDSIAPLVFVPYPNGPSPYFTLFSDDESSADSTDLNPLSLVLIAEIFNQPDVNAPSDPFSVSFLNPCTETQIVLTSVIPKLDVTVLGPAADFTFTVSDSASDDLGQAKKCGDYTYEIIEAANPTQVHT